MTSIIIQNSVFKEEVFDVVKENLKLLGDLFEVKVLPFVNTLEPEPLIKDMNDVFVLGSVKLLKIAKSRNYSGKIFYDPEIFDVRAWQAWFGDSLLNIDSNIINFKNLNFSEGYRFVRPVVDLKLFNARVVCHHELREFKENIMNSRNRDLNNELIAISSPKNIIREYRLFFVEGEYITSSMYKTGSRVFSKSFVEEELIEFSKMHVKNIPIEKIRKTFSFDVCFVEDFKMKIIELNCINCSGFYNCDVPKLIQSIFK
jgi:hypothetical protein